MDSEPLSGAYPQRHAAISRANAGAVRSARRGSRIRGVAGLKRERNSATRISHDVQKLAAQSGQTKKIVVALSGQVSPRLREELEKRGMTVQDRLVPGPLK